MSDEGGLRWLVEDRDKWRERAERAERLLVMQDEAAETSQASSVALVSSELSELDLRAAMARYRSMREVMGDLADNFRNAIMEAGCVRLLHNPADMGFRLVGHVVTHPHGLHGAHNVAAAIEQALGRVRR